MAIAFYFISHQQAAVVSKFSQTLIWILHPWDCVQSLQHTAKWMADIFAQPLTLRAGEMAQSVMFLFCKQLDLSFIPRIQVEKCQASNSSFGEAEASKPLGFSGQPA